MKLKAMDLPEQIRLLDMDSDMHNVIQYIAKHDDDLESYYVCDIGDIVAKYTKWQQYLSRIKPYYSVRCNNSIVMMELMAALGSRFGCTSKYEIREVLNLGVSAEHIIFANPVKLESDIQYAAAVGVNLLVVDHQMELYKIKRLHPEAKLLIHVKASVAKAVHNFDTKIGCELVNNGIIDTAQSLGLEIVGVSFHMDPGCLEYEAFQCAIAGTKNLFAYSAKLGYKFSILNIGGGFLGNTGTAFTELAKTLNLALEEHFPDPSSVAIDAEVGHFYSTSAFTLVTCIHLKKEVISKDQGQEKTNIIYYINNSKYSSFSTLGCKANTSVPVPKVLTVKGTIEDKMAASSIFGPTCDSADQIMKNVLLPVMDIGDYIVFENMGAYTLTSASTFNGLLNCKVHIFVDENLWEKLKDMLPLIKRNYSFTNIPGRLTIALHNAISAEHEELDH